MHFVIIINTLVVLLVQMGLFTGIFGNIEEREMYLGMEHNKDNSQDHYTVTQAKEEVLSPAEELIKQWPENEWTNVKFFKRESSANVLNQDGHNKINEELTSMSEKKMTWPPSQELDDLEDNHLTSVLQEELTTPLALPETTTPETKSGALKSLPILHLISVFSAFLWVITALQTALP